jgi:translation initiation factor IF-2
VSNLAKKRVYEIAKDYKISSDAMLKILKELGFSIRSHMSTLDDKMVSAIEDKFEKEKKAVRAEYDEKKRKIEERGKKEILESKVEVIEEKFERLEVKKEEPKKRKPEFIPFRRRKKEKRKKERTVDQKAVKESVKRTLTQIETSGKIKKYKKRTKEEGGLEEERNVIRVSEFISVAELASAMEVKPAEIISKCLELGLVASINQRLDMHTIETLALEFGFDVEQEAEIGAEEEEDSLEDLKPRAPVITVMGHVDHGKTSLLDYIRKSNVIAGEYGGITQHIGAYEVKLPKGDITFLDTPGHHSFTAMRARGVQVTDIVVLVVAADDAVMPQTIEALDHAKSAGVPIIVAINKIDLPTANSDLIKNQLSKNGLIPEEWGGKTIMIEISAKTGQGIEKLLEMILLQAEILELKANPQRNALGTVIEAEINRGRGIVVTVLIQKGTLRIGDPFVVGPYSGKVRALLNERGSYLKEAGPSTPVQLLGSDGIPQAGDSFMVTDAEQEAREISSKRLRLKRERDIRQIKSLSLSDVYKKIEDGEIKELRLIIKGDVDGSVEVLSDSLEKVVTEKVRVRVIHKSVGAINETDVLLAIASQAIIIGFHVRPDARARELATREKVDIRIYNIIYEVEKDMKKAIEGLLEPEISEKVVGLAEVKEVFKIPQVGQIAGSFVLEGVIKRGDKVRIIRDGLVTYDGKIFSLRRFKDDVKEVANGLECGLRIENYNDVKIGDQIEAYEIIEVAQKLEM